MPASEESILEKNRQLLLDMFGEDACMKKASTLLCVMLDKSQSDILDQSWRLATLGRLSAYKESYRNSFPVHKNAEEGLKLDDIVETFLIKRQSTRAVFKRNRSLYTQHLKEIERLAFHGQTAARTGILFLYILNKLWHCYCKN